MTAMSNRETAQSVRVGVRALRNSLTTYLQQVAAGTAILVTSRNTVIAEIRPPTPAQRPRRQAGALRGQIRMADDFDEWPQDMLDAMEA